MDNVLKYKITRARRNTIQITIKDCNIYIRAPYKCPSSEIEKFINKKMTWITSCLEKQNVVADKLKHVECNNILLFYGNEKRYDISLDEKEVKIFYLEQFNFIREKVSAISNITGLKFSNLMYSDAETLWGSCDNRNNIRLNLRLSALPIYLIDYVIVHELSHTRFHDHSKKFWQTVESIIPDYKSKREELKAYYWLLKIYR